MGGELSIITLIREATIVVQAVMLLLLWASVYSWYLIFHKRVQLQTAKKQTEEFEKRFWSGGDLAELYRQVSRARIREGMEGVFAAGFGEFLRIRQQVGASPEELVVAAHRAMKAAHLREIDRLEAGLPTLATTGSTSPYVGLFGTVWGIMHSFHGLGNAQQVTLAMVAPGISEALIATAIGLFAAIPAVIAYNRFSAELARLDSSLDGFREEFVNILQRSAASGTDFGRNKPAEIV